MFQAVTMYIHAENRGGILHFGFTVDDTSSVESEEIQWRREHDPGPRGGFPHQLGDFIIVLF